MNRLFLIALIPIILFLITSCSYGHKNFSQSGGVFQEPNDFVIQIDDYGNFWDPEVAERAVAATVESSKKTNTIVVVFIHGWHHNAKKDDGNVNDFASSLSSIRKKLHDFADGVAGPYRQSRERLTGDGDVNVIGIYVGWRGKSLPMPLDYLTFWGRKPAAERIGRGDLRVLLSRLDVVYKERNNQTGKVIIKEPFMGMVSIGHSFGGQILYSSIRSTLEDRLIEAAEAGSGENSVSTLGIDGFGTLNFLINPALEAMQYERVHELSRRLKYEKNQTPIMMVVSSETDLARKIAFPIGRWIGSLARPSFRDSQKDLWLKALGEYKPHRTHSITLVENPAPIYQQFDPAIYTDSPCSIVNFDLTNVPEIGGVTLVPTSSHVPYSPFLVAYADARVVVKHSGIFEEYLSNFLNDYVAIAEGKRILLRDPAMAKC